MIQDFKIGDLVKWKTTWGFVYATVLEKQLHSEFGTVYTCLHEGEIVATGFRSYMTLMDEPHEETLHKYFYQLQKEKESC